ncbi:ATP synthase F1 subunit gamma [Calderihabitans maritimus]|uniref:ATP synthase gamma chain n=1 Tax=Calderihabitans maritimus TaxID=1246530 RepID=A0A1Z5HWP2_9FIRM|nr:ATP synthase F1 subunit gamma [Calderihabitans maritimus]GAW93838.1 ATP synthase F1 subcomplex gamma subunit [Calderihabitans maritimus]
MPGMRDIKRRIRSIKNTQQITKAMEMVAAAKLRKSQEKVIAARPYSQKLQEVLNRLMVDAERVQHPLMEVRETNKLGYIVITADRGLCGGYNANIIRLTERTLAGVEEEIRIVAVGRKGRDYFRRRGREIVKEYIAIGDDPTFTQAKALAHEMMELFEEKVFDKLYLVYTEFVSTMRQVPKIVPLLPLSPSPEKQEEKKEVEYIYEPSPQGILENLLPRFVETQVYQALLEAKASEHGARMTAMRSASDNAAEMIDRLTLSFNRARQAAITKEISEIVGGAEALKG